MERAQKIKSKIRISTIGVFLLCFILSSFAYGQDPNDPGEPDTVWIGKGKGFGVANRAFPIPVEIFNVESLGAVLVPLRVQEVSTFPKLDSVSFIDRLGPDSILDWRTYSLQDVDGVSPDSLAIMAQVGWIVSCLAPGSGKILNLWFTGDCTGLFVVDTCRFGPNGYLVFSTCDPGGDWIPVFISDTVEIRECGDVNQDDEVGLSDVVYLINYVFRSGSEPIPIALLGDVNEDNNIDIIDVVFLINYLFGSGLGPCSF